MRRLLAGGLAAALLLTGVMPATGAPRVEPDSAEKLHTDSREVLAHVRAGRHLEGLGNFAAAAREYGEAIDLRPRNYMLYVLRGHARFQSRDKVAALDDFNQAVRLSPGSALAHLGRGGVLFDIRDYARAGAEFDQAIRLEPSTVTAYDGRGYVRRMLGQYGAAITDYKEALRLSPRDLTARVGRGLAHARRNEHAQAIADFDQAIRLRPRAGILYRMRADSWKSTGRYTRALADYEKAVRLDPKERYNLNALAYFLATVPVDRLRDGKRAVALARKAAESAHWEDPYSLAVLAAAYRETGEFEKAERWQRKALELYSR